MSAPVPTPAPVPIDALVLAGGASRRMGRDKVILELDGERLIDRVVRRVSVLGGVIVVAAGPVRALVVAGAVVVEDPGHGPMGGVAAALPSITSEVVVVVAADQPHVDVALLRASITRVSADADVDAAVPWIDGHPQVLHAAYRRSWLSGVVTTHASLRAALRSSDSVVRLGPTDWPDGTDAVFARDWDTPEDIRHDTPDDLRVRPGA